jgi:hypothetical protein
MSKLLSQNDKVVCENIVRISNSIDAKRAKALLLIDEGNTHLKAAGESTLSIGQVRYVLAKYRSIGLAFFPAELTILEEEITPIEIKIDDAQIINKKEPVKEKKPKIATKKKKKEKVDKKSKKTKSSKEKKDSKKKDKKNKNKKNSKVSKKKEKKSKKKKKK